MTSKKIITVVRQIICSHMNSHNIFISENHELFHKRLKDKRVYDIFIKYFTKFIKDAGANDIDATAFHLFVTKRKAEALEGYRYVLLESVARFLWIDYCKMIEADFEFDVIRYQKKPIDYISKQIYLQLLDGYFKHKLRPIKPKKGDRLSQYEIQTCCLDTDTSVFFRPYFFTLALAMHDISMAKGIINKWEQLQEKKATQSQKKLLRDTFIRDSYLEVANLCIKKKNNNNYNIHRACVEVYYKNQIWDKKQRQFESFYKTFKKWARRPLNHIRFPFLSSYSEFLPKGN